MLERFKTEIAQGLGSMSHAQLEDICWEGAQYLLIGDWRCPSVGLAIGQFTELAPDEQSVLVALRVEPLVFSSEFGGGERLHDIRICNALEMLLKEAEELGVASLLMNGLQKFLLLQGLDPRSTMSITIPSSVSTS